MRERRYGCNRSRTLGPGFKYHVVTISAIFFALTVGIVIGSLFLSPRVANRQTLALNNIRATLIKDNSDKKIELKQRQDELDRDEKLLAAALPAAVHSVLTDIPIAIIQTGDYPDPLGGIQDTLKAAGARITSVTTIERPFAQPDELLVTTLTSARDASQALSPGETGMKYPTNRTELANALAAILAKGDTMTHLLMPDLERAGLVRSEIESDYSMPARYVILLGGTRDESSIRTGNVDLPLIAALQAQGITVVACEPHDAVQSDIKAYHDANLGIGTVDNADTYLGRWSLVWALQGAKDDYGIKPTANLLMPNQTAKTN